MFTSRIFFFLLTIFLLSFVRKCESRVSCAVCDSIRLNITTDVEIPTSSCSIKEEEVCTLILRIDYTDGEKNFVSIDGVNETILTLTNGEPQIAETTSIWFNEVRLQRMASINCFSIASCGFDQMKKIYRDTFRPFQYETIQQQLANLLYSSSAVSADLTCSNVDGGTVPCPNGFCRSIFDGNGLMSYSSCMSKGNVDITYGLIVSKVSISDFPVDQSSIIYTCNKPQCNSRSTSNEVLRALVNASLIPSPSEITTTTTTTTTTTKESETTTNDGRRLNSTSIFFISFILIFFI